MCNCHFMSETCGSITGIADADDEDEEEDDEAHCICMRHLLPGESDLDLL